jgi:hypothetical protein
MKTCNNCGETKPLNQFTFARNKSSGAIYYKGTCKECTRLLNNREIDIPKPKLIGIIPCNVCEEDFEQYQLNVRSCESCRAKKRANTIYGEEEYGTVSMRPGRGRNTREVSGK